MAKDGDERKPYISTRTWVDGSITDDQPAKRIARQYGVNHFISSQANPLVVWGLNLPFREDSLLGARGGDLPKRLSRRAAHYLPNGDANGAQHLPDQHLHPLLV